MTQKIMDSYTSEEALAPIEDTNNISYKKCTKCKRELPRTSDYFHRDKKNKDGFQYVCKECRNEYYRKNREKILEYQQQPEVKERRRKHRKEWKKTNREHIRKYNRKYRQENSDYNKEYMKKWREENKEHIREYEKGHNKKYYYENKDKVAGKQKEYYEKNKDKILEHNKKYRETNKDEISKHKKEYHKRPEVKKHRREYYKRPEVRERIKRQSREYFQKLKENNPDRYQEYLHYWGIHKWARKNIPYLDQNDKKLCLICNERSDKTLECANINHEYNKDPKEWIRVCVECHLLFDITYNS